MIYEIQWKAHGDTKKRVSQPDIKPIRFLHGYLWMRNLSCIPRLPAQKPKSVPLDKHSLESGGITILSANTQGIETYGELQVLHPIKSGDHGARGRGHVNGLFLGPRDRLR